MDWTTNLKKMLADATPLVQRGALSEATQAIQNALNGMTTPAMRQATQATQPTGTTTPQAEHATAAPGGQRTFHGTAGLDQTVQDIDFVDIPNPAARGTDAAPSNEHKPSHPPVQGSFRRVAFQSGFHAPQDHYWLYTPAGSTSSQSEPRPLVLMLHGCTQNPQDFAIGTGMNEAADAANALVLYPAQPQAANPNGCWNWFRPQDQSRDSGELATLVAMVREVMAQHAVDERRVYVAGLSAGGAMAALLAREYPDLFAAAGVHSGLQAGAAHDVMSALSAMKSGAKSPAGRRGRSTATASTAVPLIVFHGDADSTVNARNAEQIIDSSIANAPTVAREVLQGQSSNGQRYTRTTYRHAADPTTVAEQWVLHGASHAWAGGDARGSYTDPRGVSASQEMLRFFLEHPRQKPAH